jgi:hypothetical protein
MTVVENEITVRLSPLPYQRLRRLAEESGRSPESLTQEIVERALAAAAVPEAAPATVASRILAATGRVREVSPALRGRIIPGVTLDEVRAALDATGDPSLSEIVLRQRS